MEVKNDFTQGPVWKCILKMAVPMTAASLVNVLYSIVDRMYIGHIQNVGSTALTGLGLAMPVISVISAFTALYGTGGAPLCSIARGEGDLERAEQIMGNAFTLLIITGLVLTGSVLGFLEPILRLFGASDATLPYALTYARIYVSGTICVMISLGMNYFINSQGFAKIGMLTVLLGAVINIILDPILIFVLDMGIAGAAYATLFSQLCSAVWVLLFLTGKKAILKLRLPCLHLNRKTCGNILGLGVTGFVMNVTNGLVQIACNAQLARYGGDLYVGAMTIVNSLREVMFMGLSGMTQAAQPVMGYNYGAGRHDRIRTAIRFTSCANMCYAFLVWGLMMFLPGPVASLFNSDPELLEITVPAIRMHFAAIMVMSLMSSGQCVFVGLGKAKFAIFFSMLRKVVIVIPLIYLLPLVPQIGANGVFLSEPFSDVLGGFACFLTMYFTVYKKLGAGPETGEKA